VCHLRSSSARAAGWNRAAACQTIGRPNVHVPRKISPAMAVLNDSFATRKRASPEISAKASPTPNSASMNAANPSKRRVRVHTYAIRRPATTVPPSSATYGEAPIALSP
jgi:hypothetical protein